VKNGFAAIRPPGHHAGAARARGFCYFNNIAICAKYAQAYFGLKKILIIDWDVHPGDGTMEIFYEDPDVYFLSIHQDGIFTDQVGTREQIGKGAGENTTCNLPLPEKSTELDYFRAFEPALERMAEQAKPELILISCGFDAHQADPLGRMSLKEESFGRMTKMVMEVAAHYCQGRVVSLLEGGYEPQALARCIHTHLETLIEG
jgi:acetoin utilization deacetylase AcuC-like enzyme